MLHPPEYAEKVKVIHGWARKAGRDPKDITLSLRVPLELAPRRGDADRRAIARLPRHRPEVIAAHQEPTRRSASPTSSSTWPPRISGGQLAPDGALRRRGPPEGPRGRPARTARCRRRLAAPLPAARRRLHHERAGGPPRPPPTRAASRWWCPSATPSTAPRSSPRWTPSPSRRRPEGLKRIRNLRENPRVSIVIDEYDEDWTRAALRHHPGRRRDLLTDGPQFAHGVDLLLAKYAQYRDPGARPRARAS